MKEFFKNKKLNGLICALGVMIAAAAVPAGSLIVETAGNLIASPVKEIVIIDPGHGGFDGGAENSSGVCEKDINLAIGLALKEILEENGYKAVMTRESDTALGESESSAIRSRKTADLAARKKMIDEKKPLLTVSIHLNSFKEDTSVRGAQVFYPDSGEKDEVIKKSKALAEAVQSELVSGINDGTDRVPLGKSDVRILKNPYTPIIIVECGFLSNYEEAKMLESREYQRKLAECIYNGIVRYTNFK